MLSVASLKPSCAKFQFQDGSIKCVLEFPTRTAPTEFQFQDGSIKCAILGTGIGALIVFQFQDGSIKCRCRTGNIKFLIKFQFQDGSIKWIWNCLELRLPLCFNSKMVRLNEHKQHSLPKEEHRFNSKMVRLNELMVLCRVHWVKVSIPRWFD